MYKTNFAPTRHSQYRLKSGADRKQLKAIESIASKGAMMAIDDKEKGFQEEFAARFDHIRQMSDRTYPENQQCWCGATASPEPLLPEIKLQCGNCAPRLYLQKKRYLAALRKIASDTPTQTQADMQRIAIDAIGEYS